MAVRYTFLGGDMLRTPTARVSTRCSTQREPLRRWIHPGLWKHRNAFSRWSCRSSSQDDSQWARDLSITPRKSPFRSVFFTNMNVLYGTTLRHRITCSLLIVSAPAHGMPFGRASASSIQRRLWNIVKRHQRSTIGTSTRDASGSGMYR